MIRGIIPCIFAALLASTAYAQQTVSNPTPATGTTVVANGKPADTNAASPLAVPENYRLDTGDVIQVDVLRHGDVSRSVRLLADAKVRLPRLVEPIEARGKTCPELTEEVVKRLTREGKLVLRPGQVSVSVIEMRMRHVYVRGNAGKSADFNLVNGWRVTELCAVMGGVQDPERVTAKILNPHRPNAMTLNLSNALRDADSADNMPLLEGDTLVLELPRTKRLYIKGEGPRGEQPLDERFGLRQALVKLGFTLNGATGDVRNARLIRHTVPGDPNSPETRTKVDLFTLLSDDTTPDIPLEDLDTLDIPPSEQYIYVYGETSIPRKVYLPQDRPTYLVDVMAMGGTTGRAKIDDIKIVRSVQGKPVFTSYKFGKFLSSGDMKQNPQIQPKDMIVVPDVKRPDVIGNVWQAWGLFGIVQALVPQTRLR